MPREVTRMELAAVEARLRQLELHHSRSSRDSSYRRNRADETFPSRRPADRRQSRELYVPPGRRRLAGLPTPTFIDTPASHRSFRSRESHPLPRRPSNASPLIPWTSRLLGRPSQSVTGVIDDDLFLSCPRCRSPGRSGTTCSRCRFIFPCFLYADSVFAREASRIRAAARGERTTDRPLPRRNSPVPSRGILI
jgi:hypothetical protein